MKPGSEELEFAEEGGARDAEGLGGLFRGGTEEAIEFEELDLAGVEFFEFFEGEVEVEEVGGGGVDPGDVVVQGNEGVFTAAALAAFGASVVDEDQAHKAGGEGEEVLTVLEIGFALGQELEVEFVDERGGLEGVAGAFGAKVRFGDAPELGVDGGQDLLEGLLIAIVPFSEQRGYVRRVHDCKGYHGSGGRRGRRVRCR